MKHNAHSHRGFSVYREFPVPASMASHFLCFWKQVIVGSGEYAHRVLPDACMDIVFINDASPIVVGPWTDPFVARFPAGTKIVGARLHPGLAPSVLGISAAELLNQSAPYRTCGAQIERASHFLPMSQRLFRWNRYWPGPCVALLPPLRRQAARLWQESDGLRTTQAQLLSN